MKRLVLYFSFLLTTPIFAQSSFSILFVDDSPDAFGNAEYVASALDSLSYTYTYFDAQAKGASPSYDTLMAYDLVIWHCSTNGAGNYLWDGLDQDNPALLLYLESGKNLWLIGNDFLFDRYGQPPFAFSDNDFPRKYFGIASYDAQSYGDDGALGVPGMTVAPDSPVNGLKDLKWSFATLWWGDALTAGSNAKPVYLMGGDSSYPLKDLPSALLYTSGNAHVLTYAFDLALIDNFANLKANVSPVLNYFQSITAVNNYLNQANYKVVAFPNPSPQAIQLQISDPISVPVHLRLFDTRGREVASHHYQRIEQGVMKLPHTEALVSGTYFWEMKSSGGKVTGKVIKQ